MIYSITQKIQIVLLSFVFVFMLLAPNVNAGSKKIDVSKAIKSHLESDSHLKHLVLSHANLSGSSADWVIGEVSLGNGKMKKIAQHIPVPSGKYEFIASTQYENCGGLEATREIDVDKEVEDGTDISTENSFGAGLEVSAEVSADVGPVSVGGSVSVSASYDFSKGEDYSHSSSVEIDDDEEVDFSDEVGVWVFGLYAKRVITEDLPWWIDFVLEDDSVLNINLEHYTKGASVNFFSNNNYSGKKISVKNGEGVSYHNATPYQKGVFDGGINSIDVPNDRINEISKVCVYAGENYSKQFQCVGASDVPNIIAYHGGGSDKFKTVAVLPKKTKKLVQIRWSAIKEYFSDEQSRFRINGILSVKNSDVDSKRFVSAQLSPEKTKEICDEQTAILEQDLFGNATKAEKVIKTKELSKEEYLELLNDGHLHNTKVIDKSKKKSGESTSNWFKNLFHKIFG